MTLTKDQILAASPKLKEVEVPEWGGSVFIRPGDSRRAGQARRPWGKTRKVLGRGPDQALHAIAAAVDRVQRGGQTALHSRRPYGTNEQILGKRIPAAPGCGPEALRADRGVAQGTGKNLLIEQTAEQGSV